MFPCREPRKQSLPHRAPSRDDLAPGRVFRITFGRTGSQTFHEQSQTSARRIAITSVATCTDSTESESGYSGYLSSLTDNQGRDEINHKPFGSEKSKATKRSENDSVPVDSSRSDQVEESYSLASQYLDTMVMNDGWRAACKKRIRQVQRKQRPPKRPNVTTPKPLVSISKALVSRHPKLAHKERSFFSTKFKSAIKSFIKYEADLPTPPLSPKTKYGSKPPSPDRSSGQFVSSSSPTPAAPNYLRIRSTRNCPIIPTTTTLSIDIPASMIGRSCLSCGCTNTTCWRRTLGGIICNSCGLR